MALLGWLLVSFAAAAVGGFASIDAGDFYLRLAAGRPRLRRDPAAVGALIAATAIAFYRIRPLAGILLLPYLTWVSFAAALTWAVWQRNPGLL